MGVSFVSIKNSFNIPTHKCSALRSALAIWQVDKEADTPSLALRSPDHIHGTTVKSGLRVFRVPRDELDSTVPRQTLAEHSSTKVARTLVGYLVT